MLYWAPSPSISSRQEMGAGPHVRGVIGELERRGHTVIPVFGGDLSGARNGPVPAPTRQPLGSRLLRAVVPAGLKYDLRILRFNPGVNQATTAVLQQTRPDLIYERDAYLNGAGPALARRHGIPHVLESDVPLVGLARLEFGSVLTGLAERVERRKHRDSDLVVVSSETARQALLQMRALPPTKVVVKHLGVAPEAFDPADPRRAEVRAQWQLEGSFVVGYTGSFRRHHGVGLLLEATRGLQASGGLPPAVLLVGAGGLQAHYQAETRRQGPRRAVFPGLVPHAEVPAYLAAMDVAVVPDAMGHVLYPIKLLEYGAMARAVVAPDLPPFREVIEHGETGLLFPPGSAEGLAAALRDLADDPELRRRLGDALRQRVLGEFSWSRVADRLLEGLERVVRA